MDAHCALRPMLHRVLKSLLCACVYGWATTEAVMAPHKVYSTRTRRTRQSTERSPLSSTTPISPPPRNAFYVVRSPSHLSGRTTLIPSLYEQNIYMFPCFRCLLFPVTPPPMSKLHASRFPRWMFC